MSIEHVSNQELVSTIVKCLNDYRKIYTDAYEEYYKDAKINTPPGELVPPKDGVIYNKAAREIVQEELRKNRAKGFDVLDRAEAETKAEMMTAPSAEAVSMLQAVSFMDNQISADDLRLCYDTYGKENYLTHIALNGLARRNGYPELIQSHPLSAEAAELDNLRNTIRGLTLEKAEKGGAEAGSIAFIVSNIESKWGAADSEGEAANG